MLSAELYLQPLVVHELLLVLCGDLRRHLEQLHELLQAVLRIAGPSGRQRPHLAARARDELRQRLLHVLRLAAGALAGQGTEQGVRPRVLVALDADVGATPHGSLTVRGAPRRIICQSSTGGRGRRSASEEAQCQRGSDGAHRGCERGGGNGDVHAPAAGGSPLEPPQPRLLRLRLPHDLLELRLRILVLLSELLEERIVRRHRAGLST
mmetsp:Transcript_10372/g.32420  ORF Transcript_10372/g.32420 Transcript_10372/m.32420 type:complete len:209 (+) Transcript_10372:4331-4957(+)